MSRSRSIGDFLTGLRGPNPKTGRIESKVRMADGAKMKIDGHAVRPEDQTRYTVPTLGARRQKRRGANRRAKAARRRNR